MGRHVGAVGQKRHGTIGKAADDLHAHEDGGNDRRPFGTGFGPGMALAQEHMVTGPDAMVVGRFGGVVMIAVMTMVLMALVVAVMAVRMTMRMIVTVQGVVVRHAPQSSALPPQNQLGEDAQKRQKGPCGNKCAKQQKPGISNRAKRHDADIIRSGVIATTQTARLCVFTSAAGRGR